MTLKLRAALFEIERVNKESAQMREEIGVLQGQRMLLQSQDDERERREKKREEAEKGRVNDMKEMERRERDRLAEKEQIEKERMNVEQEMQILKEMVRRDLGEWKYGDLSRRVREVLSKCQDEMKERSEGGEQEKVSLLEEGIESPGGIGIHTVRALRKQKVKESDKLSHRDDGGRVSLPRIARHKREDDGDKSVTRKKNKKRLKTTRSTTGNTLTIYRLYTYVIKI